jgi:hypothetical protein
MQPFLEDGLQTVELNGAWSGGDLAAPNRPPPLQAKRRRVS